MGATHSLMKRLPNVAAEMALHVLAYNLTRVMNIIGRRGLIAAIRAAGRSNHELIEPDGALKSPPATPGIIRSH